MGQFYRFTCPARSYEATVSGGLDMGMSGYVHTASCRTCRPARLVDSHNESAPYDEIPAPADAYSCPYSKTRRHVLTLWTHPGPCPRCQQTMTRDEETLILWD